ncbi:hypothetical protein ACHAWF_008091, partial [Thalassiosira exigua]
RPDDSDGRPERPVAGRYDAAPPSSPALRRRSSVAAVAAAEVILRERKLSASDQIRRSSAHPTGGVGVGAIPIPEPPIEVPSAENLEVDELSRRRADDARDGKAASSSDDDGGASASASASRRPRPTTKGALRFAASQVPAVAIVSVLNFMVGIPFGASYFPPGFPLEGKEVLGLRMFLFTTAIAQLVFTWKSRFEDGNVPFCLELARIAMEHQTDGTDAVSTLFFLFGLSSVVVGLVFYALGRFELGRVVYFFPSHVLVGCIGGIGAFIVRTSVEVTTNATFSFTVEGFRRCVLDNLHLLAPVVGFEVALRTLMKVTEVNGEAQYPLLGPIYYCLITPAFYAGLWAAGATVGSAEEAGYFFPPIGSSGSVIDASLFDIFREVRPAGISWTAVAKALPTMVGLTAFSLIHVPINIPAFAISTNVEPDMNAELIAHGYSNALAGIFGGLQNYMAYSNSVIYSKSNGRGKASSLGIVATTILIFIYGPTMASYVPRCMAGTLLLHVGVDLFLEGVVESYEDFDRLEYAGGMDAALVAGVIAALSTYAAQSVVYQDPIRGSISGARLRSSAWNRCIEAQKILQDKKTGRQRIHVILLQGHIFFGNVAKMMDDVKASLNERNARDEPAVVIIDFTHVLGLDSSAAQSIAKLKSFILKNYGVEIVIFVTGHADGFRCAYNLSHKVVDQSGRKSIRIVNSEPSMQEHRNSQTRRQEHRLSLTARALHVANTHVNDMESMTDLIAEIPNSRVCESLDDALLFAEDVLIALENPSILRGDSNEPFPFIRSTSENMNEVKSLLETLCPGASPGDIDILFSLLSIENINAEIFFGSRVMQVKVLN